MNIDTLELHDALIHGANIDYAAKQVALSLEIYETPSSKTRTRITMIFDEVDSISHVADFNNLEKNRFAGNINSWIAGSTQSPTYIYC